MKSGDGINLCYNVKCWDGCVVVKCCVDCCCCVSVIVIVIDFN